MASSPGYLKEPPHSPCPAPHVLHHLAGGASIDVIHELAGHADIGTTTIYSAVVDQRLKEPVVNAAAGVEGSGGWGRSYELGTLRGVQNALSKRCSFPASPT
jgi:hypothetical protein